MYIKAHLRPIMLSGWGIGWSDFETKIGHLPSCTNSKISPFKVAYFWGARPLKILPVTLKAGQILTFNII